MARVGFKGLQAQAFSRSPCRAQAFTTAFCASTPGLSTRWATRLRAPLKLLGLHLLEPLHGPLGVTGLPEPRPSGARPPWRRRPPWRCRASGHWQVTGQAPTRVQARAASASRRRASARRDPLRRPVWTASLCDPQPWRQTPPACLAPSSPTASCRDAVGLLVHSHASWRSGMPTHSLPRATICR